MGGIQHPKTNTIANWTQTQLNEAIARGQFPEGTLLADIVLPSDWNDEHDIDLTTLPNKGGVTTNDLFLISNSLFDDQASTVEWNAVLGAVVVALGPYFATQPSPGTLANNDSFWYSDSTALDAAKRITWLQLKAALSSLYAALSHVHSGADITSGSVGAAFGGTGFNGGTAPNGALPIGNSTGFTLATLTAGTNVIISNSAGGITIAVTGGGGAGPSVVLDVFVANGTWTRPAGIVFCQGWLCAGGAGGASGRRGPTTGNRTGGGGAGGGAFVDFQVSGGLVGATEAVTVGAGGAGGAAITVDSTDGNIGVAGSDSLFGTWCVARGGFPGVGGINGASASGGAGGDANGARGGLTGAAGGAGRNAAGTAGNNVTDGAAGGGGGGGAPNGGGNVAGGAGGSGGSSTRSGYGVIRVGGTGGTAAGVAATAGASGPGSAIPIGGAGGGGGYYRPGAGGGGSGAVGGFPGGGGGGGGAGTDAPFSENSGAGGAGAGGVVIVLSWCT